MTLSPYHLGATTHFACQADQRFSYCLYVPPGYGPDAPLVVVVHGTERAAQRYRDAFARFAEHHGCLVLAPLFPCGIGRPGELDDYKWIAYDGIRFDHVLLAMVDEVAATWGVRAERLLLHGFSGGGHFAHRFLYLHPRRLRGVSIGAPGVVTLLDPDRSWWVGVRDLEARFGRPLDLEAIRAVPVQTVIGGADTETWEIAIEPGGPLWMDGAELAGTNRLQRLDALRASLERHGVAVRHDVVPGAAHDGWAVLDPVRDFLAAQLTS